MKHHANLVVVGMLFACGADAPQTGEGDESTGAAGSSTSFTSVADSGWTATSAETTRSSADSVAGITTDVGRTGTSVTSAASAEASTTGAGPTAGSGGSSTTGSQLPCGNGALDEGEECDDGNTDDNDACTAACTVAFCGDGILWEAQEECDDGNADDADGCDNACVERFPVVYLYNREDQLQFWRYVAEDDVWETLTGPWGGAIWSLAWDGATLYGHDTNNGIFAYDPVLDAWAGAYAIPAAPGARYSGGGIEWTDDGLYLFQPSFAGSSTIYVWRNDMWSEIVVNRQTSQAGSWDPDAHELYVRDFATASFLVLDTTTDTVAREFDVGNAVVDITRDGVYLDGSFYVVEQGSSLLRLDVFTGVVTDTGVTPTSLAPALVADPYKRQIYVSGIGGLAPHFERYDVETNSLTTLASVPTMPYPGFYGWTSMVLVYP